MRAGRLERTEQIVLKAIGERARRRDSAQMEREVEESREGFDEWERKNQQEQVIDRDAGYLTQQCPRSSPSGCRMAKASPCDE